MVTELDWLAAYWLLLVAAVLVLVSFLWIVYVIVQEVIFQVTKRRYRANSR
jgi:hypothetical protein